MDTMNVNERDHTRDITIAGTEDEVWRIPPALDPVSSLRKRIADTHAAAVVTLTEMRAEREALRLAIREQLATTNYLERLARLADTEPEQSEGTGDE